MNILANCKERKDLVAPSVEPQPSTLKVKLVKLFSVVLTSLWQEELAFSIAKLSDYSPAGLFPEDFEKHAVDVLRWVRAIDQKVATKKKRETEARTIKQICSVAARVEEAERLSEATLKPLSVDHEDFRNRVRDEIKKRQEQNNESVALKSRIEAVGCC